MKRVPGPLLSLVLLLVKPGIVTSTTRELCRPDLDDLLDLLVLLGAVEANEASTILLESQESGSSSAAILHGPGRSTGW